MERKLINWMEQAVSDLSADSAPSKALWDQLSALYGSCGIYLFTAMNWVSGVGYRMFPLADAGKDIVSFQEVMHIAATGFNAVLGWYLFRGFTSPGKK